MAQSFVFIETRESTDLSRAASLLNANGFEVLHVESSDKLALQATEISIRAVFLLMDFRQAWDPAPSAQWRSRIREILNEISRPGAPFSGAAGATTYTGQNAIVRACAAIGFQNLLMGSASAGEAIKSTTALWPVERVLSKGERSIVYLVHHPTLGRSVAKMFRPGAIEYFERHIRATEELAALSIIPAVLDRGSNWFLAPLYEDTGRHLGRSLRRHSERAIRNHYLRELHRFVADLRYRRRYLLDLTSHNLVCDSREGLKVLDLEFYFAYGEAAIPPLKRDLTVTGAVPPGSQWDTVPLHRWYLRNARWHERPARSVFFPVHSLAGSTYPRAQRTVRRLASDANRVLWWFGLLAIEILARFRRHLRHNTILKHMSKHASKKWKN